MKPNSRPSLAGAAETAARERAKRAVDTIRAAAAAGTSRLNMREINAEIAAVRADSRKRRGVKG
jgi:hypothetical protein